MKRVGVLRGGTGNHYESSLKKGGDVLTLMAEQLSDKYKPIDIFVDREGLWHIGGVPVTVPTLAQKVDVVWSTMPPEVTQVLHNFSIPHINSSPFSSLLVNSRDMLREHMQKIGINLPRHIIFPQYQEDFDGARERYAIKKAKETFEKFGAPWIIKSFPENPNVGVYVAKTFNELAGAIDDISSYGGSVLVEELVPGKSTEVHSIAGFRGEDVYTMPVVGLAKHEKEKIYGLVKDLFHHLDAKFYLNTHFTMHPKFGIYLTGVNFLPNLEKDSHFHQSCESVGARMSHVVEHILERL